MARNRVTIMFIVFAIVAVPAIASGSFTSSVPGSGAIEGAAIPVGPEHEQELLERMDDFAQLFGVETRDRAFLVFNEQGTWVVFADEQPHAGIATVSGFVIEPDYGSGEDVGIVFADNVEVETRGQPASIKDVAANPEAYEYELVRVEGSYRQFSLANDVGDSIVDYSTIGVLTDGDFLFQSPLQRPGEAARWATLNFSSDRVGGSQSSEISAQTFNSGRNLLLYSQQTEFWHDGTVTVDALVIPQLSGSTVDTDQAGNLYLVDTTVKGKQLDSVAEISQRGDELEGEVVTITSPIVGSRISSQEFLVSVAECAPDSVTVPMSPPLCVPVTVDTTIHTGVVFSETSTSPDDVVPFAGISNQHQSQVIVPDTGHYQITGRVVASEQVGSPLPGGYALIVYDMERIGGLAVDSAAESRARDYAALVEGQITAQLNGTQATSSSNPTSTSAPPTTETQTERPISDTQTEATSASSSPDKTDENRVGQQSTPEETAGFGEIQAPGQPGFGFGSIGGAALLCFTLLRIRLHNFSKRD